MKNRGYLGIDESNHGKFPEIFVGVFTETLSDTKKTQIPKRRGKDVSKLLGSGRQYRHIRVLQDDADLIKSDEKRKLVVFAEFIKFFGRLGGLEQVIIDGLFPEGGISNLRKIIYPLNPIIVVEPFADETYNLVNIADGIANRLHRYYAGATSVRDKTKYLRSLLTPKWENYAELLI